VRPTATDLFRLLWLHGWSRTGADFAAAAKLLADDGIASVALDLPGFGASPLRARPVQRLVRAPAAAGPRSVRYGGAGRGGPLQRGSRCHGAHSGAPRAGKGAGVERCATVASRRRAAPARAYRVLRELQPPWHDRRGANGAARQKYGSSDYRNATGLLREILVASVNENFEARLDEIVIPVALVWGVNDRDVPIEVAQRIGALLARSPDVELDVLTIPVTWCRPSGPRTRAHVRRLVVGP